MESDKQLHKAIRLLSKIPWYYKVISAFSIKSAFGYKRVSFCFFICLFINLTGCSSSIGIAGSALVREPKLAPGIGARISTLVHPGNEKAIAVGVESIVLERVDKLDHFGQWRLSGLFGYSDWPQLHQGRVGFEALLSLGAARAYIDEKTVMKLSTGALLNLPIRLSGTVPEWYADDFFSFTHIFVPQLGANYLVPEHLEVTFSLSYRIQVWSATLP